MVQLLLQGLLKGCQLLVFKLNPVEMTLNLVEIFQTFLRLLLGDVQSQS